MPAVRMQHRRYRIASDRSAWIAVAAGIRLAAALLWLSGGAAVAQPTPVGTPEDKEANALFAQLLKDPTNVDLNFRYAEAAIKLGNYEGAVSALERLLLYNPNFPGVKLQLAELYTRLGSYNTARAYLQEVESSPGVTPGTRARVQALRDQIDRVTTPSKFAANLVVGLRHQTNDSAEPAGSDIIAGGLPATLSAISLQRPGWDSFLGGNVAHTYDFGDFTLESNALIYYSKQFRFSSINSAAVEVNSGPRFDIGGSGAEKIVSLRPYALANEVLLGNNQFLWTVGAGLGVDRPLTERVDVTGFYEFRSERFSNLAPVPFATDMDAGVHSTGGSLSSQILDNGTLGLQASYAIDNARQAFASNDSLVLKASYTQRFRLPPDLGSRPLVITPLLYRIYTWNAAANPAVDPTLIPISREWRYGVTGELGLTTNLALTAFVIREAIASNLPADRSSDTQAMIGLRLSY